MYSFIWVQVTKFPKSTYKIGNEASFYGSVEAITRQNIDDI